MNGTANHTKASNSKSRESLQRRQTEYLHKTNGTAHNTASNSEARESLRRRQAEHLRKVKKNRDAGELDDFCAHDRCGDCLGTFVKLDGSTCVHMISCTCSRCVPAYPRPYNPVPLPNLVRDRNWYYPYHNWQQTQIPSEFSIDPKVSGFAVTTPTRGDWIAYNV